MTLLWICAQSEKKQSLDQALRGRPKLRAEVSQEGATPAGYQGRAPGGDATVCLSVCLGVLEGSRHWADF